MGAATGLNIEVDAEDSAWSADVADIEGVVERAARRAGGDAVGSIAVLLTDDDAVRDLNARFRDKDRPTNVLSFPGADMPMPGQPPHLGDIVLAHGVCAGEAEAQGKTMTSHLTHLVVHGVLHLLGCDHMTEAEAKAMEAEEKAILAELGIADPYVLIDDH
jgi:probable rRNA maturation factor